MAAAQGPFAGDLTQYARFAADPRAYHVFLAMRVIEARFGDAPRLGRSRRPRQDAVRLGQEPSMAFQPTAIAAFRQPQEGRPGQLVNLFFGLFGPHGPLPAHLTEYARERLRNHRDPTFAAFADMLTHRPMSLLYRAWLTGQPAASHDRGENGDMERKVAALAGYMGHGLTRRDAMPDLAKRHFAGLLARGPRHAQGLAAMLASFFRAPVRLQQFVGSWLTLEPADRWALGGPATLGRSTSIGERVWSRDAKFRIRIGPLSLTEYRALLPGGAALARLAAVVRNHAGDTLDWDVNLVLRGDEVPPAVLGDNARLGHVSWIGRREGGGDVDDLLLDRSEATAATTATEGEGAR